MAVLKDLLRDGRFALSSGILCILFILAAISAFSPYDPLFRFQVPRDLGPSWTHLLGTSSKGQDVFWQTTFAIRNTLIISIIAASFSRVIAILIGFIAGYLGGITDRVLSFITDGFLIIPLFLILVFLAMLLRGSLNLLTLGLLLGVFGWAWDARLFRSEILSLREREFTFTAILSGTRTLKLVSKEYFPFVIPLIFSTLINNMSWSIGTEITLSILGLTNPDVPTLGTMIHWAIDKQAIFLGLWWWLLTPVITAIFLFVALYMSSVSISEYLDPRTRAQRVGKR